MTHDMTLNESKKEDEDEEMEEEKLDIGGVEKEEAKAVF
jgi:hypothetical protein